MKIAGEQRYEGRTDRPSERAPLLGRSVPRVEDAALLTGGGRFIDDLPVRANTAHAAILRSPHAHAEIHAIDTTKAEALEGVYAVVTGDDVRRHTASMKVGVKTDVQCWPMATDRVRYVGEPVALVVARDRYVAEDALDLIEVNYDILPAVIDPLAAIVPGAPLLHPLLGTNLINERSFSYGEPEKALVEAPYKFSIEVVYPRNACTPIETYGVVAEFDVAEGAYDITANFQGPFSIHTVLALALKVPGNRLRLRTPRDSGGSFGVKQGVFPYIVLIALAARLAGRPVKWVEDRLEHLSASVSATNRVTRLEAAVERDGLVTALFWDQLEDCGAHLRAPEPATLYRMHGNMTGAYAIRNVAIRNRVVLTNKTPTGLNRGFGGPQVYFALERLMHKIAVHLRLDPLDVIRRNLVPTDGFPYRTASGALLDSGDYESAITTAVEKGGLQALIAKREQARAAGRLYGIGMAAIVEPSVSNMGYVSTVLTPEARAKAGPKNGAQSVATVAIDPLGTISMKVASVPQGQGHRTVLAQVVSDVLGLPLQAVQVVADVDTGRDAWSIASGNYSSRFAAAVAGAARLAAERLRDRLAMIAASQLNVPQDQIVFIEGEVRDAHNPDNAISFGRLAATSHWSPAIVPEGAGQTISETVLWTPKELGPPTPADEINSSLCHGFIFDFCGVEIDSDTGEVRINHYVTMHDCGRILHPGMVEGQIRGGFAQAVGAALYEEYAYAADGSFLTGTLADYLIPTVMETPDPIILHQETPSPFTPLGAKGVGEGNCMSTPVCIANAVADALGVEDIRLPLSPSRISAHLQGGEPGPSKPQDTPMPIEEGHGARKLTGEGETSVMVPPQEVWRMLLDPQTLAAVIPGAHDVRRISDTGFQADVTLGVGPVKGRYKATIELSDMVEPERVTLTGRTEGALGFGHGLGRIILTPTGDGTRITYVYEASIGGKVASVGGRLLDGAARVVIGQFFKALARHAGGQSGLAQRIMAWLRAFFGGT